MRTGTRSCVVFNPLPPVKGFPQLEERRSSYTTQLFKDWLNVLYQLVMDNVNFDGEPVINAEENTALGGILQKLKAEA